MHHELKLWEHAYRKEHPYMGDHSHNEESGISDYENHAEHLRLHHEDMED